MSYPLVALSAHDIMPSVGDCLARGPYSIMKKFLSEKWAEIMTLAILIPFTGWVVVTLVTHGEQLVAVQTNVEHQGSRITNIVAALPEVRDRFAQEIVHENFRTAMIVTNPELERGGWVRYVHILDPDKRSVRKFVLRLDDENDVINIQAIYGLVAQEDEHSRSFNQLAAISRVADFMAESPSFVDDKHSMLAYDFIEPLMQRAQKYLSLTEVSEAKVASPPRDWKELSVQLNQDDSELAEVVRTTVSR